MGVAIEINTKSRAKKWKPFSVAIVGGCFSGRARPLVWVSRAANLLHLRNRIPWSRQPGPPQVGVIVALSESGTKASSVIHTKMIIDIQTAPFAPGVSDNHQQQEQ